MPSPSRSHSNPQKIQITPPGRIRVDVMRAWYTEQQAEAEEVKRWLIKDLKAKRGIERTAEEMLRTAALEATPKAIEAGVRDVRFTLNLAKIAQQVHQKLTAASPDMGERITPRNILVAFELLLRQVGYEINAHLLEVQILVPTQEELDEERALAIKRKHAEEEMRRRTEEASQQPQVSEEGKPLEEEEEEDLAAEEGLEEEEEEALEEALSEDEVMEEPHDEQAEEPSEAPVEEEAPLQEKKKGSRKRS